MFRKIFGYFIHYYTDFLTFNVQKFLFQAYLDYEFNYQF